MVNASILPFEPARGAAAPQRPLSPDASDRGFGGAMDDALGTRATRRDDSPARSSRRAAPARPRETSDCQGSALSRKAANPGKAVSARKANRADETEPKAVERDDESSGESCAPADAPAQPAEAAKTAADGAAQGDPPAEAAEGTVNAAVETTVAVATDAGKVIAATDEDSSVPAEDPMARGRRWQGIGEPQAGEAGKAARTGVARGPAAAAMSTGPGASLPVAGQPIEAAAGKLFSPAATPHDAAVSAQADAAANAAAANGAVTAAVETVTSKPQTASAAAAMTAIEAAVANVAESIAAVETSAGADAGTDTREQGQPKPQAPSAPTNVSEAAAVTGPSDGPRFTVNSAAGNAAYTNATPRHEEAVLPQIVQSIRLHAVQGTTEARVQLKPEHLGTLNITLKVEQNQVTATIHAGVAAVRSWIESHESSLRQALSDQGLQLARLVVHPDDQQAAKDEHDRERPRRQPRRRSWRDEEATFEVLV